MTTETEGTYDKNNWLNIWITDPDMKKRLRVLAAEKDMSMSQYVRTILERHLNDG